MTETYFPFDGGAGATVTEANWYDMAKLWQSPGVVYGDGSQLIVSASSGMVITVGTGAAWIYGGFYRNSAAKSLTIASNVSGNPRIDSIVLTLDLTGNSVTAVVVQGTPASSPIAPTLTSLQMLLANITVANGAANILAGNIQNQRTFVSGALALPFTPVFTAPGATFTVTTGTGNADPDNNNSVFRVLPGNLCWFSINQVLTFAGTPQVSPVYCTLPFKPRYVAIPGGVYVNNPGYATIDPVTGCVVSYLPGYANGGTAQWPIGSYWWRTTGIYQMTPT